MRDWAIYGDAVAADRTLVSQYPAPFAFYAARFVYANYDTAASLAIGLAKCAPAATNLNNGSALSWVNITFNNGSTSGTIPQATNYSGGASDETIPGVLISDLIDVSYIARSDGGAKYLLQTRSYFALASTQAKLFQTTYLGYMSGLHADLQYGFGVYNGDAVTAPAVSKTPTATGQIINPVGVIFYGADGVRSILNIGDSLTRGTYSSDVTGINEFDHNGWALLSARSLTDAGTVTVCNNWALPGQMHENSMRTARQLVPTFKPDAVTLFPYSPNNGDPTQAKVTKCWADFVDSVRVCKANGSIVVGMTSPAFQATTVPGDVFRVAINDQLRALAATGQILLCDADELLTDYGQSPPAIKAEYDYDGTHFNDDGHAALAALLATTLTGIIGCCILRCIDQLSQPKAQAAN